MYLANFNAHIYMYITFQMLLCFVFVFFVVFVCFFSALKQRTVKLHIYRGIQQEENTQSRFAAKNILQEHKKTTTITKVSTQPERNFKILPLSVFFYLSRSLYLSFLSPSLDSVIRLQAFKAHYN